MADAPFGTHAPNSVQTMLLRVIQGSRLKRGAFRPLMSRLIGPAPVDTTYQGARFRLHHHDSGTERGALFNPRYNIEELDFLRQHLPAGGVFVDVGANVGTFAVVLALHVGASGRVIAIEPHPTARARLRFNIGELPFRNVTLVEAAAGDIDGEVTIGTPSTNLGASRVGQGDFKVPSRRLAGLLADNGIDHVDALKIDVEGYEDKALVPFFRDAPATLWPTAVAIEHLERNLWAQDCIDDMVARGYAITGRTRSNTFLVRGA
ncbi:FkbM family methyltransferase [Bradyrhizobium sp. U87765 SZCCT0131]|uniref:FkbM family methyltransferase n=1 Tax=unclassified Bradyrhizobium TaxID=2631580 RepID=UPI001BA4DE2C|nr:MULTISPECIES: FkbM family methyltransferase [unclassified Bradyrhizobium]MBR1219755.1 FkbM family methyltransferase [Bradyrhizobium sp. U87765 SZCCT0131]MBR1262406.1 FkbM family methyltransferase [Bradyrhizobium sp. U87765 SZCCT0134]MBR1308411.1 FkbM family methyltransferase [Bradyrhizobium sp. U87765 SZCCT0110]MBR1318188.1 FkbM family methyltransferase [Bradyrhizobium sp. U87765 SZCCT0109]MBR1351891.1 FkbM family methyltransferase [Bradyrhizobium sp. U87765 SZCCT0048]